MGYKWARKRSIAKIYYKDAKFQILINEMSDFPH